MFVIKLMYDLDAKNILPGIKMLAMAFSQRSRKSKSELRTHRSLTMRNLVYANYNIYVF